MPVTQEQLEGFVKLAADMRLEYYKKAGYLTQLAEAALCFSVGKKFAKVYSYNGGNPKGSVWAFISLESGDIYKPASYAAPAKHARGNIAKGLEGIGPYGPAYLR